MIVPGCLVLSDYGEVLDLVAGVCGVTLSTYCSKSRSVPGWAYSKSSVVVVGLGCGKLIGCCTVGAPWSMGAVALASLGRWDNARAEFVPRWEEHGNGSTRRISSAWAVALAWTTGGCWSRIFARLFRKSPVCVILVSFGALALFTSSGVSFPGGPRRRAIDRKPSWKSGRRPGPAKGWKFISGPKSHEKSHETSSERLTGESIGRSMWHFVEEKSEQGEEFWFDPSKNPNSSDKIFRKQLVDAYPARSDEEETDDALRRGLRFYRMLQTEEGNVAGDYGGPHFLSPGLVIVWYVTGRHDFVLDKNQREAMIVYYKNHQQSDGGWGTHIESPSTMFGSTLTYVALRLLGLDPEKDECMVDALNFVRSQGGALYTSSWAKFGLCLLGVMDWEAHESVPPEMWLLPTWCPFHPCRMWCHARMVYLPMSYLWGKRWVYAAADRDPTVLALRKELYLTPDYHSIPWTQTRRLVADMDNYSPVHPLMRLAQRFLRFYEHSTLLASARLAWRRRGVEFAAKYCYGEDLQTNYVDIGPVNKVWNTLVAFDDSDRPDASVALARHAARIPDYLWVAEDGMKMNGYNGSQCWDTSFFTQALVETRLGDDPEFAECSKRAFRFLERTQILSTDEAQSSPAFEYETPEARTKYFRHVSKGGWPFSTSAHGWPISDCTAEALKSVLAMQNSLECVDEGLPLARLADAVNVILTLQNADGGWATYENNRGYGWYEWLNPSEVFGDIMIDYSYVECSMASAGALKRFHESYPHHRPTEILDALRRGNSFLKSIQRSDGSWYGSWGCCFTYAGWFGIEGLVDSGEDPATSPHVKLARDFLLSHQQPDGSWGETFESCFDKKYSNGPSNIVNTSWALLGLMAGDCPDVDAVEKGIEYLIRIQEPSGDWPQQGISGVFNRACGITYTAYRNVFPLWALARYETCYKPKMLVT